ncbi:uncharacterized protein BO95DRAFT_236496 [Aspergillus brunneoviolaceus CBS 621.78]|uniref:Uncharacterized protein n=1 Tax=Aspergillus brunneoviolaceus CBS 621.78 TaxID=1450534 RepID=A0ACD1FZQ2_9EURO|nr:hypothetical protein BO95DRAFT_236496 [Aspergillus brunneoviolaceus CBS 621.78]RAH42464.1 hypothetical protein BO95DRAFT_236496 [Aspergillus brunneoviolaceus CBS 621.78]
MLDSCLRNSTSTDTSSTLTHTSNSVLPGKNGTMSAPECPKLIYPAAEADEDLLQHFDVKVGKDGTKLLQFHLCKRLMRNVTFSLKWHLQHVCERIREKDETRSMCSAAKITPRFHYDDEGLVTHIKHTRIVCRHCHEAVTDCARAMRAHVQTCLQGRTQPVEENAFAAELRRDYFEISSGRAAAAKDGPSIGKRLVATARLSCRTASKRWSGIWLVLVVQQVHTGG